MERSVPGRVVANFRLADPAGRPFSLWDYRQRQPVVLVVWDASSRGLLASFEARYPEYRRVGAEVLAISREPAPEGSFPFPLLQDPDGGTIDHLSEESPAVLVLDAFGCLFTRWQGSSARVVAQEEILSWAFFTQVQCEECGIHAEHWHPL